MTTTQDSELDKIIYRCFVQGQYWGTASGIGDEENKLNPDYEPDEPIDRTRAVIAIKEMLLEARIDELYSTTVGYDNTIVFVNKDGTFMSKKERIAQLTKDLPKETNKEKQ